VQTPLTVVTGGGRGIGAAICRRLAADGHDVVFGYRSNAQRAQEVVEAATAHGGRCVAVEMDVASQAGVDRLFAAAGELGPVTGLVNNAGIIGPAGRLVDLDPAEFGRVYDVNVIGTLLCCRRAARDGVPAIVNLSSVAAVRGSAGEYVHYAGAKAAVETITVGLAKELAPDIRVNCVAPGIVWTEIHADPQRPARLADIIPLGRAGEPEEIAGAVAWLLSADASYTTGAILRVTGGL
jgi:NAD(P)-dependent dehydrogenase (short-subunit alcohol dehydrogenase family)